MSENSSFTPLLCINRIEETKDSATFEFRHLDHSEFSYKAGQFISFDVEIACEHHYRAYSFSSTPDKNGKSNTVSVTIKRVEGGKVSNHLLDYLKPNMVLPAMEAAGEFTLETALAQNIQQYLFLSAGSGITPCLSMAKWLLENQAKARVEFIYCARSEQDIILASNLAKLDDTYENFKLSIILETLPQGAVSNSYYPGLFNLEVFTSIVPYLEEKHIYSCGPSPYLERVITSLKARNFDMTDFYQEDFDPEAAKSKNENMAENSVETFQMFTPQYGKQTQVSENQSLLEALEEAGVPIIGACRAGVCGSCKCKVSGEVDSSSQATLTAEQIDQGYVLSCSSTALSDLVVEF